VLSGWEAKLSRPPEVAKRTGMVVRTPEDSHPRSMTGGVILRSGELEVVKNSRRALRERRHSLSAACQQLVSTEPARQRDRS
jgi:hypothetical protein